MTAVEQCISELEAKRAQIDEALRVLKSLAVPAGNGVPQRIAEPQIARRRTPKNGAEPKAGRASGLRVAVRAAIEQFNEEFQLEEVASKLEGQFSRKQVSDALCQLGIAGHLRKTGRGRFVRVGTKTAVPAAAPQQPKVPEGRSPTERMTNALLAAVGRLSPASLSAAEVVKTVRSDWPGLWDTDEQETNLRVRLLDLAGAGRIHRDGRGPDAKYSARS